jgi:hypothetical protein
VSKPHEFAGGFPAEPELGQVRGTSPLSRVRKAHVTLALLVVFALGAGYLLGTAGGSAPAQAAAATSADTTSAAARATLTSAIATNRYFSPLFAPWVQQALVAVLGGPV